MHTISSKVSKVCGIYFFSGSLFIVPDAPLNLGIVLVSYCLVKLHNTSKNNNFLLLRPNQKQTELTLKSHKGI